MSRLLSAQTTKHDGKRDFCLSCLNGFATAESLAKHKEYCKKHPVARRDLPVVFHNLSNYDSHLFIKKMFIKNPEERLECIPNNEEKYISLRKEIVLCHYN